MTGEWAFEEPATKLFSGDLGLVLKVILVLLVYAEWKFFPCLSGYYTDNAVAVKPDSFPCNVVAQCWNTIDWLFVYWSHPGEVGILQVGFMLQKQG